MYNEKERTMADRVLFIGWNWPVVGREQQAVQLFSKCMQFYGKLRNDRLIESFEPVILFPHGGDLNGFFLIKGDAEKLDKVVRDEAFMEITTEARHCLQGVGVISGYIGEGLNKAMSNYAKLFSG